VRGQIRFDAHNGDVHLKRVAGDVGGATHNGRIEVELMGSIWDGRQLEVTTHNGGINVAMPAGYSARVQAETSRGRIQSDFPITVSGELRPRRLDTNIGFGGPLIRLTTHNGQVTLKRAGSAIALNGARFTKAENRSDRRLARHGPRVFRAAPKTGFPGGDVASSGKFSRDRSIAQYASKTWSVPACPVKTRKSAGTTA